MTPVPAMPRHVLLFDVDLTLLRTGRAGPAALTRAFAELTGIADGLAGIDFMGRTDRWIVAQAAARAGVAVPPDYGAHYTRVLREELPDGTVEVMPGVHALLDHLHGRADVVLGLGTGNLREAAFIKLRAAGLERYFTDGGFGDDHEERADMLRAAVQAVRWAEPDRLVVIGDSVHDVRGARAVGARAVAVATGWASAAELHAEGPDVVLRDLSDIDGALQALLGDEVPPTDPGLLADHRPDRALV